VVVDANEYPSVVMPFGLRRSPKLTLRAAQGMDPGRLEALVRSAPARDELSRWTVIPTTENSDS